MAQPRDFICRTLQAGQATCSYGCTPHRIMCHAFFDDKCSVCEARYCEKGWHEYAEHDLTLQHATTKKDLGKEPNNRRPQIRLRSVAPPRKQTKRSRSEKRPRTQEEDIDTDTEIQTNIDLCQLKLFHGMPDPMGLESAYKQRMRETHGNARDKAETTKAFRRLYQQLERKNKK